MQFFASACYKAAFEQLGAMIRVIFLITRTCPNSRLKVYAPHLHYSLLIDSKNWILFFFVNSPYSQWSNIISKFRCIWELYGDLWRLRQLLRAQSNPRVFISVSTPNVSKKLQHSTSFPLWTALVLPNREAWSDIIITTYVSCFFPVAALTAGLNRPQSELRISYYISQTKHSTRPINTDISIVL